MTLCSFCRGSTNVSCICNVIRGIPSIFDFREEIITPPLSLLSYDLLKLQLLHRFIHQFTTFLVLSLLVWTEYFDFILGCLTLGSECLFCFNGFETRTDGV